MTDLNGSSVERIDEAAVWSSLTPMQQTAIGSAAIALAVAWNAIRVSYESDLDGEYQFIADEGGNVAAGHLEHAVLAAVPGEVLLGDHGRPKLPVSVPPMPGEVSS
ncbi:hypothetical protein [Methylobrevis pamukkalensis]|uniref:Uncharacterized protein n=1 Tax=Methylobrevis pamukkalensis TaxID=1439726 RepID=A0A1E3H4F3_9HYPH|nr:hypothetical protein [Methylobrevis pamukkalensis]ODN71203.1 hypothetical protein A6302_01492 [Methylobrevis pamukkalensis]